MRIIITYIVFYCFVALSNLAAQPYDAQLLGSQSVGSPAVLGTEYYVSFLPNDNASPVRFLGLYITSEKNTNCTLEIPGQPVKTIRVEAGKVTNYKLELSAEQKTSEVVLNGAIHITSRNPISVFAINSRNKSTACFAVLPVNYWGTDYLPVMLPNADNDKVCRFMIIANEDSTQVIITPSTNTTKYSANQKINVRLNKGQIYMVSARQGETGFRDLTASVVKSNKPIGLISGHTRTPIFVEGGFKTGAFAAHQSFMMMPDSAWGKDYLAIPSRTEGDRFRLVASQDSTVIIVSHLRPFLPADKETIRLDRGEIKDISKVNFLSISNPTLWSSNKPVFIAQMRTSGGDFPVADNAPSMMPLVPTSAFTTSTIFSLPSEINDDIFKEHKIILFAKGDKEKTTDDPKNPLRNIKIDGKLLLELNANLLTQQIGKTDWYWDTIKLTSGSHLISSQEGYPISAELTGGNAIGDYYRCTAPTWIKSIEPDIKPPVFVKILDEKEKGKIRVSLTDRTSTYFSGIARIELSNSPGWQIVESGISNNPDEDAEPVFRAIQDPSGELNITATDYDGNTQTIKIYNNLCFKTASLRDTSIRITVAKGKVGFAIQELAANICGDSANLKFVDFTVGDATKFLSVELVNLSAPVKIKPFEKIGIRITANPDISINEGLYSGLMRAAVDDSVILLNVNVEVIPYGSVDQLEVNTAKIAPNPAFGNLYISINDKAVHDVIITNLLGETVYSFSRENILSGKLIWHGENMQNNQEPSGIYFVKIITHENNTQNTSQKIYLKKIIYNN